jgi:hypothetical protein
MSTGYANAAATPLSKGIGAAKNGRYLFGSVADFFLLGGSTFFILPLLAVLPVDEYRGFVATISLVIANFINYPHFAHSYQIFYRHFGRKVFASDYNFSLRLRYLIAGLIVPAALLLFFLVSAVRGDTELLAYGGNAMFFFVGWHYVKQGYGMLMVDAALKRLYFNSRDKKILLINSYAVWILSWLSINASIPRHDLFGLSYYSLNVHPLVLTIVTIAVIAMGIATVWTLVARWRLNGGTLPFNGVIAYLVTLYIWQLLQNFSPLWIFVIPPLHSLQYLAVVWRYETNYEKGRTDAAEVPSLWIFRKSFAAKYRVRLAAFTISGCILGYLGFWGLPIFLKSIVHYDEQLLGAGMFLFVFWVFINVHHYFLDNVTWRRENSDMRYLFG